MKHIKSVMAVVCAAVTITGYILPAVTASAVSSASLSIVPKKNYTIEAGKTVNDTLVIRNLDKEAPLELSLSVVDFTFDDDSGTPKLMLEEGAPQTTWSLKPFLAVPRQVSIEPNGSKTLDMSVSVPEGHGAGSYYSAIVYSSGEPVDGGNVGLSASGVTLVFASIPGTVNENLRLEKFGMFDAVAKSGKGNYMTFSMDQPQTLAYTIKNEGNVTASPVGSITITDIFGRERLITDVNPNSSLALIGQSRTFNSCIKLKSQAVDFDGTRSEARQCDNPGMWPGFYRLSLNLFYGQNGNRTQEITGSSVFWYMPMWFIVVLIVGLGALAFGIWRVVRMVRQKLYGPKIRKVSQRR